MAVTRANEKRKVFFEREFAAAQTPRRRLWTAWRWLLAEVGRQGEHGRDALAERLKSIAAELNGADQ